MERPADCFEQRLSLQTRGVAPAESLTRLLERHAVMADWREARPPADAWERRSARSHAEVHGRR